MTEFIFKVKQLFSSASHKRTLSLVVILSIIAAVPLTVFIAQKQQEIRQRASEPGGASEEIITFPAGVSLTHSGTQIVSECVLLGGSSNTYKLVGAVSNIQPIIGYTQSVAVIQADFYSGSCPDPGHTYLSNWTPNADPSIPDPNPNNYIGPPLGAHSAFVIKRVINASATFSNVHFVNYYDYDYVGRCQLAGKLDDGARNCNTDSDCCPGGSCETLTGECHPPPTPTSSTLSDKDALQAPTAQKSQCVNLTPGDSYALTLNGSITNNNPGGIISGMPGIASVQADLYKTACPSTLGDFLSTITPASGRFTVGTSGNDPKSAYIIDRVINTSATFPEVKFIHYLPTLTSTPTPTNTPTPTLTPAADTTPPTSSLTASKSTGFVNGETITLTFNASDNAGGSGIKYVHVTLREGVTSETEAKTPLSAWNAGYRGYRQSDLPKTITATVPFYMEFLAEDNAGNKENVRKFLAVGVPAVITWVNPNVRLLTNCLSGPASDTEEVAEVWWPDGNTLPIDFVFISNSPNINASTNCFTNVIGDKWLRPPSIAAGSVRLPKGFATVPGSSISPNTTYYVKLGGEIAGTMKCSGSTTFSIPQCAPLTSTPTLTPTRTPTPTATRTPTPTTTTYNRADVNHDGHVCRNDLDLWIRAYLSIDSTPYNCPSGFTCPDGGKYYPNINGDSVINLLDYNIWYNAIQNVSINHQCQ